MARLTYGPVVVAAPTLATTDDPTAVGFVTTSMSVYRTQTGGTAETNLLKTDGVTVISVVTPDSATGAVEWQGPDGYVGMMWLEPTAGGRRWPVIPNDIADRVGSVSSVNTKTGAVTLTADDIPDGPLGDVIMLGTERTKLSGIATGATANLADSTLLARPNHTGLDNAPSGAVPGQVMTVDINGHVVAADPPTSATPVFTLNSAVDVDTTAPVDGDVQVWSQTAGKWMHSPRARAVYVYNVGENMDVGQPPGVIGRRAAVTIIKTHVMEGTSGTAVTTTATGYNSISGGTVNYSNLSALVGTTAAYIPTGQVRYFVDSGLALDVCVVKRRIRFVGPITGAVNFARMGTAAAAGIAVLQRDNAAGAIKLKNGSGTTLLTTTFTISPDTWYIYEWKVGNSSQTLRWYDSTGATLMGEVTIGASAGQIDNAWNGMDINANSGLLLDDNAVAADFMGNAG